LGASSDLSSKNPNSDYDLLKKEYGKRGFNLSKLDRKYEESI
jgi:hypothetical protein